MTEENTLELSRALLKEALEATYYANEVLVHLSDGRKINVLNIEGIDGAAFVTIEGYLFGEQGLCTLMVQPNAARSVELRGT